MYTVNVVDFEFEGLGSAVLSFMCSINADICQFIVLAERDVDGIF
jgi:hypothetical protein